jgi:GxxExxY protein
LIENQVIVELKAVVSLKTLYEAPLVKYVKAIDKKVGLLINFNAGRLKAGIK